jgi:hypothetical protein
MRNEWRDTKQGELRIFYLVFIFFYSFNHGIFVCCGCFCRHIMPPFLNFLCYYMLCNSIDHLINKR